MEGLNSKLKSAEEIIHEPDNRSKKIDLVQFIIFNTAVIRWKFLRDWERYRIGWKTPKLTKESREHIDQRTQKNEVERLKEIMAENFPELMKDMIPQILETT